MEKQTEDTSLAAGPVPQGSSQQHSGRVSVSGTTSSSSSSSAYHLNSSISNRGIDLGDARDGAYTRKWFNQEVTPVLLEGMRYLAREKYVLFFFSFFFSLIQLYKVTIIMVTSL